jgi:phosphatidylserine synthase
VDQHPVITIDEPSSSGRRPQPGGGWLHGRRILLAGVLALAEIVAYLIVEPNRWFAVALVGVVLAAAIAVSGRIPAGQPRDIVLVVGLAQAMVIALPILVGVVTLVIATITVLLLIAVFVLIGLRFRR